MSNLHLLFLLLAPAVLADDLPTPRIVILGQTGAGKSTLANVLVGNDVECESCTFPVCDGYNSCTKETKYAVGQWLGQGATFTIVDTPGFGDSDNDDNQLIDEMMTVLTDTIVGANGLLLLINGEDERFDQALQQMMREMQALFGETFWEYTILGVSHWPYDANSVASRNHTGKSEEKFMKEWNELLQQKFHLDITLDGVFIDAWSRQPWNIDDEGQQVAFQREVDKLWRFVSRNDLFAFKTVEDVLNENQRLKAEVEWLNEVITQNITLLADRLDEVSEEVTEVRDEVVALDNNIDGRISLMNLAPVGTIIAWTPYPDKDTNNPAELPQGWVPCDGTEISEGIWKGRTTPDLNTSGRFLRGGKTGDALELEEYTTAFDQEKLHYKDRFLHAYGCPSGSYSVEGLDSGTCNSCYKDFYCERTLEVDLSTGSETRPKNMKVVFVMKIK